VAKLVFNRRRATMAERQLPNWRIFCVIIDENSPFSVKIQSDATVGELKRAIKVKKQPSFDDFAADRLTLFKVDVRCRLEQGP